MIFRFYRSPLVVYFLNRYAYNRTILNKGIDEMLRANLEQKITDNSLAYQKALENSSFGEGIFSAFKGGWRFQPLLIHRLINPYFVFNRSGEDDYTCAFPGQQKDCLFMAQVVKFPHNHPFDPKKDKVWLEDNIPLAIISWRLMP